MTDHIEDIDTVNKPPHKKLRTDDHINGKRQEREELDTEGSDAVTQNFNSFENFEVVRVLNSCDEKCSIAVEARLRGSDMPVLVQLQKLPFNQDKLSEIFTEETTMRNLLQNDVYFNQMAILPQSLNEIKATIVYPAEDKHLKRFERHSSSFIYETPRLFEDITKPYALSSALSHQWIYNILDHKKEVDRIVCEDMDPDVGFVLIPDLKWTGEQVEDLYLQAIVMRRDISCIRDLTADHIPLLENIYNKCTKAIEEKYGVAVHKLRIYFHYQPSFYHLHIHFSALSFDAPGTFVGKAHAVQDVISNLRIDSQYYKKATLGFTVKDNHPLWGLFNKNGSFSSPQEQQS